MFNENSGEPASDPKPVPKPDPKPKTTTSSSSASIEPRSSSTPRGMETGSSISDFLRAAGLSKPTPKEKTRRKSYDAGIAAPSEKPSMLESMPTSISSSSNTYQAIIKATAFQLSQPSAAEETKKEKQSASTSSVQAQPGPVSKPSSDVPANVMARIKQRGKEPAKKKEVPEKTFEKTPFDNKMVIFSSEHRLVKRDKYDGLIIAVLNAARVSLPKIHDDLYDSFKSKAVKRFKKKAIAMPLKKYKGEYYWLTDVMPRAFEEVAKKYLKLGKAEHHSFIENVTKIFYQILGNLFAIKNKKKIKERDKDKEYQEIKKILEGPLSAIFNYTVCEAFIARTIQEIKGVVDDLSQKKMSDQDFIDESLKAFTKFARQRIVTDNPPEPALMSEKDYKRKKVVYDNQVVSYDAFREKVVAPLTAALQNLLIFIKEKKGKKESKDGEYHEFIATALKDAKQENFIGRSTEIFEQIASNFSIVEGKEFKGFIKRATKVFERVALELPVKEGLPEDVKNQQAEAFVKKTTAAAKEVAQQLRVIEDEDEYTTLMGNSRLILDEKVATDEFRILREPPPPPSDAEKSLDKEAKRQAADEYFTFVLNRVMALVLSIVDYNNYLKKRENGEIMFLDPDIKAARGVQEDIFDDFNAKVIEFIQHSKRKIPGKIREIVESGVQQFVKNADKNVAVKTLHDMPTGDLFTKVAKAVWDESNYRVFPTEAARMKYLEEASNEIQEQLVEYLRFFVDVGLPYIQSIQSKEKAHQKLQKAPEKPDKPAAKPAPSNNRR